MRKILKSFIISSVLILVFSFSNFAFADVAQFVDTTTSSTYQSISGSTPFIIQQLGTGLTGNASNIIFNFNFQSVAGLRASLYRCDNSTWGSSSTCTNAVAVDSTNTIDGTGYVGVNALYNATLASSVSLNATKYYYLVFSGAGANPNVKIVGSSTNTYANGACYYYTTGTQTTCASSNGVSDIYFVLTGSAGPLGDITSQVTPVDGQNNPSTITFTGTYNNYNYYNSIFASYSSGECASFTRYYLIPLNSVVSANYSFFETFSPNCTWSYTLRLAKDGGNYSTATSADTFGTSSFTTIPGVTISGTGTITNSAGSGTVTGSGTSFLSTVRVGDTITVGGETCTVLSVVSDTLLECSDITSAHTGSVFTFASNTPLASGGYSDCGTIDIFCYLRNFATWFFYIQPSTLTGYSNLVNFTTPGSSSLASRLPFAYIYDVGNIFNELFANGGSMEYAVSVPFLGSTINLISASQISAVPYASTIKTILGYLLYFMTAMTLYRYILKVHNKTS